MCGNVDFVLGMCYNMDCDALIMSMSYFDRLFSFGLV